MLNWGFGLILIERNKKMEILKFRVDGSSEWHEITAIKGEKGDKGETGKTPIKGTDYWNESDKTEMKNYCNSYIDSQLGIINEQLASLTEVK
jgi:hypothetical protein